FARCPATRLLRGTGFMLPSRWGGARVILPARPAHGVGDFSISTFTLVGHAMPVFWLAQMLILFFALRLDWLPVQGMTSARERYEGWQHVRDVLEHMILPVAALTVQQLALTTRLTRTSLLEVLSDDFIRTGYAKGLSERAVLLGHALPNALLPVVTVIGGRVGFLVTGAVLTETVFAWPGIGRLLVNATLDRDFPILMGLFLLVSVTVLLANLLTDLTYAYLDPRIRYE
ncbi:MAG: ABC transporter permease, partial [Chloroflexota bacterium]|nr:ABC transporter permease [Chloroflexota bacterium]